MQYFFQYRKVFLVLEWKEAQVYLETELFGYCNYDGAVFLGKWSF